MAFSRNFYDFQVVEIKGNNPTEYYSGVTLTENVNFLNNFFYTSSDVNVFYKLTITSAAASGSIKIKGMTFNNINVEETITLNNTSPYESTNYFLYVNSIVPSTTLSNVNIGRGKASTVPYLANFDKSSHYVTKNGIGADTKWTIFGRITNTNFNVPYSQEFPLGANFFEQTTSTTYPIIYDEPVGMLRMEANPAQGQTFVWNMGTQQIK